ncbi:hypothetical protein PACID_25840 [Acidipropionibacterium acidipropionici ATCC 4875]|uniref:Uncharacterized protein n=1 Tax=Acidipropionibacterium acidipropionici (strain ATCC 4875 / DSM 20272 / JCM 6432 / NBRC 12425 / NCIMB 8070 / 4) TaxID=1171373 RepID=K7SMG7_ACIA4|nr:hypothetical protein PACID_25840 [Acidipropionibacterium acidipropionici ATCC 4875]
MIQGPRALKISCRRTSHDAVVRPGGKACLPARALVRGVGAGMFRFPALPALR